MTHASNGTIEGGLCPGPEEAPVRLTRRLAISRAQRGFSLVEVLVVLALFTVGLLAATPFAAPMIRRAGCLSAISTVRQALALARLQAVKSGANVVVVFSQNSFGGIHLLTFQDKVDLTSSSPNDGDSLQEAGEPTLGEIDLSTNLRFWQSGAAVDDLVVTDDDGAVGLVGQRSLLIGIVTWSPRGPI